MLYICYVNNDKQTHNDMNYLSTPESKPLDCQEVRNDLRRSRPICARFDDHTRTSSSWKS